mmetsp:Transcript_8708/g.21002  ORF Transcript_8708/g.21002 Transcript_8708/m.21002 type:complete len:399 (+) Transcript_8708:1935-3131(+)
MCTDPRSSVLVRHMYACICTLSESGTLALSRLDRFFVSTTRPLHLSKPSTMPTSRISPLPTRPETLSSFLRYTLRLRRHTAALCLSRAAASRAFPRDLRPSARAASAGRASGGRGRRLGSERRDGSVAGAPHRQPGGRGRAGSTRDLRDRRQARDGLGQGVLDCALGLELPRRGRRGALHGALDPEGDPGRPIRDVLRDPRLAQELRREPRDGGRNLVALGRLRLRSSEPERLGSPSVPREDLHGGFLAPGGPADTHDRCELAGMDRELEGRRTAPGGQQRPDRPPGGLPAAPELRCPVPGPRDAGKLVASPRVPARPRVPPAGGAQADAGAVQGLEPLPHDGARPAARAPEALMPRLQIGSSPSKAHALVQLGVPMEKTTRKCVLFKSLCTTSRATL